MKTFRHGDLNLHPIIKLEGEKVEHSNRFVLQEGETTGHKHVLSVPNLEDMDVRKLADGSYCFTLKTMGTLTHEDHKTLEVPAGTYRIVQERELDHFGLSVERKVVD